MRAQLSFVLSQITRLTDGRTDGQREFSHRYRCASALCIPCSAIKNAGLFQLALFKCITTLARLTLQCYLLCWDAVLTLFVSRSAACDQKYILP